MVKRIDFGSKDAANETREQYDDYISERDDARKTTVVVDDDAPSEVVQTLRSEAFVSQDADTDSAGMRDLSEDEKEKLKRVHSNFSWQDNGFEAMRVKGALSIEDRERQAADAGALDPQPGGDPFDLSTEVQR